MRVDVNGMGLEVADGGAGPAVLLLHGFPDTHDLWRHQVPALTAAGFRTVAPDPRGFGASDRPTDPDGYGLADHVADLVGVLDRLGLDRAHVVGHDWGAVIGRVLAALVPDRVRSLTALAVGHPAAFARAGLRQREKSWYMLLFQFPGIAERWLSADGFANFRSWSSHPDADAVVGRLSAPGALTAALGIYRATLPPASLVDPPPVLPPVTAPVLGVWADGDRFLTEEAMTGSAEHVGGPWTYVRLEGAGHWMQLDRPEAVNRLLVDFLSRVAAPAAAQPSSSST